MTTALEAWARAPFSEALGWALYHSLWQCVGLLTVWQSAATPPPQVTDEGSYAYRMWLQEDVAYIITPKESEAFQALRTNPEREKFIEQFWLQRDPTPGTPPNEFKEEHYRRIAYSNARFKTASVAGWKTDRGASTLFMDRPMNSNRTQMDVMAALLSKSGFITTLKV